MYRYLSIAAVVLSAAFSGPALAEGINVVTLKQRDDTARGAGTQTWRALAQTTDVVRMETVHVFVRMNTFQHFDVINTRR